jgi:beta-xylosidase
MPNPVFLKSGITDPHIKIFNNRYYLYASRDAGPGRGDYIMRHWSIYSSSDLADWTHEADIHPGQTYMDPDCDKCFAVDCAEYHGKYYLYFSDFVNSIGVLVSDTPVGPWTDPLGKPLVKAGDVPFHRVYDPAIYIEDDVPYLIFGHCKIFIVRLKENMTEWDECPRQIGIEPNGYENCGILTEDKPFLHKREGIYYLSQGGYYSMSEHLYGPYTCKGPFFFKENFPESHHYAGGMARDRHGSFFEVDGQWYYACNELSQTGEDFFRDFSILKIDYTDNGEIIPPNLKPEGIRVPLRTSETTENTRCGM